ncbi:hypothetical protein BCR35DRAFT_301518 [Leucosporidium creatinivorum]|uniref:DUF1212-domain-containing protein n=1 Tax=Leucosporidium creatinivorum TaxID=106004 RepID=A0A1Y2FYJ7_9BASI|nr:hypothetical protein BCR35DRAFT_301518 [Leucosporidium creatinivorum]
MSTANLAGAASPSANSLAPIPSKAGYHISRYKASPPKSLDRESGRRSMESPHRQPMTRPGILRGTSVDSVLQANKRASSPIFRLAEEDEDGDEGGKETTERVEEEEERGRTGRPSQKKRGSNMQINLKDLPIPGFIAHSLTSPRSRSPRNDSPLRDYFFPHGHHETDEERDQREWAKEKRKRRKIKEKRMRQEIFITQHVAALLARQEFILKLARSFMMYGSPTHRLEAQIQATARVLELELQCVYLPGMMLISFGDSQTHTSDIKFLKQAQGLDLGKMESSFGVYNKVIRDKVSVTDAAVNLDDLFLAPPKYTLWQDMLIGGLASASVIPSGYKGSFIDCLVAIPLGAFLIYAQRIASRNDMYSSVFEIMITCFNAIVAAALARTKQFCFYSVAAGSVVLILPGYIVLCGALELANRSIVSGSVRLVYSLLYTLFLGFGLSAGSEIYQKMSGNGIQGGTDFTCSALRANAPWYRATIPQWWFFLTIPTFLLMLALNCKQPFYRRETAVMLIVGGAGYACNFFSARVFVNRPDITSAIGSFVVSMLSNVYAKSTRSSAYIVMLAGTFCQLPSGLANGGLLRFATDSSKAAFSSGISAAQSLVQVVIGTTVGLFVATAVVNLLFGGGRRRGANFSTL